MKITKVGGVHEISSNGEILIHTYDGSAEFNAGKKNLWSADKGHHHGEYQEMEIPENPIKNNDFNIIFELDKDTESVVPFGILDFNGNTENPYFSFKYTLSNASIDSLNFQIMDENNTVIYQMEHLKTVIVQASKKTEILFEAKKATESSLIYKTWDFEKIYNKYALFELADYTKQGEYNIYWDGFDSNDIYDSTRFNNKKLKAKITAIKNNNQKSIVVDFSTAYSQVEWTDVKIDKKTQRIDVTLRVDLKDGGAKGLDCQKINASDIYRTPARVICDWDKIPISVINPNDPIIKSITRSFSDLEKLAIEGLNYHWGRNKNHAEGKNVMVNNEVFEVYINAKNTKDQTMDDVSLVFNTNGDWMRSGNPGTVEDPISAVGNLISREAICYNAGYIKYSNGWGYSFDYNEDLDFKFTSAHEIGHSILKAYGGTIYSYGHKGSVNAYTQNIKDSASPYPASGEIDIMPYYPVSPHISMYARYEANVKDVLSLIWLTKIKIIV